MLTLLVGVLIGVVIADRPGPTNRVTVTAEGGGEVLGTGGEVTGGTAGDASPSAPGAPSGPAGGSPAAGGAGAAGARTAAAGAGGGSRSTAGTAAVSTAAAPAGNVRGVSDTEIRIGVAIPDISAFRSLGPAYDSGDIRQHWAAVEDEWKRNGQIQVHGRTIKFIYRTHNIVRAEEARAACVGFVQDDKVFAVLGTQAFYAGSECLAREFKTPVVTQDGSTDDVYKRSAPFLFTLAMSEDRVLRNWVAWAHHGGRLKDKTVGLYYGSAMAEQVKRNVIGPLNQLGYKLAADIQQGDGSSGEDAVAVRRFQQAGVNLALLVGINKTSFLQQSDAQGYKPTYLESDYSFGTSDAASSTYAPSQWDGTEAFTGRTDGHINAGMPLTPKMASCLQNYERYAKRTMARTDSAEMHYIMTVCDEAEVLHIALEQAGPGLTPQSFVAGLETIRSLPLRRVPSITFTPNRHEGVDQHRTLKWAGSCQCWKAVGDYRPVWE